MASDGRHVWGDSGAATICVACGTDWTFELSGLQGGCPATLSDYWVTVDERPCDDACDVHGAEPPAQAITRDDPAVRLSRALEGWDAVEALCARWDGLTKGRSPTTTEVRAAIGPRP